MYYSSHHMGYGGNLVLEHSVNTRNAKTSSSYPCLVHTAIIDVHEVMFHSRIFETSPMPHPLENFMQT
jgi:hypothetical protein